jgi:Fe-S-cluster containining protein
MENSNKHPFSDEELKKVFAKLQGDGNNVQFVDLDDEFEFHCNRCGACCTCRNDIILSPYDVYNLAVALDVTGKDVVNKYLDVYIGNNSHLPVATIADTPQHKCPFLEFDANEMLYKCKVNDHKPGPCKTHPFGIVRTINTKSPELDDYSISFIKTDFCNNHGGTKITVREYLGEDYFNTLEDRKLSYKLQSFVTKLLNLEKIHAIIEADDSYTDFDDDEKNYLPQLTKTVRELIGKAYVIPYLEAVYNYKPDKDFVSQCEQGFKDLIKSSMGFITMMAAIGFNVFPKDEEGFNAVINKHLTDEEFLTIAKELNEVVKKADEETEAKLKEMKENVNTSGN